jgi:hypothetical protein
MAIKERKQITGTTAQIQAYAGHEGQIVWDKDKKTFVGMSGTAGKNYPLAPKEYVDNKVAKCLPLTGGLLSGRLDLDPNFGDGIINIRFNYDEELGSGISFRSVTCKKDPGSFVMYAKNAISATELVGMPNGYLSWGGKEVERVNAIGENYIRYESGLQVCWGRVFIPSGQINATVTLPVPYTNSESYRANGSYPDVNNTSIAATIAIEHNTYFKVSVTGLEGNYNWNRAVDWIAIGRWK